MNECVVCTKPATEGRFCGVCASHLGMADIVSDDSFPQIKEELAATVWWLHYHKDPSGPKIGSIEVAKNLIGWRLAWSEDDVEKRAVSILLAGGTVGQPALIARVAQALGRPVEETTEFISRLEARDAVRFCGPDRISGTWTRGADPTGPILNHLRNHGIRIQRVTLGADGAEIDAIISDGSIRILKVGRRHWELRAPDVIEHYCTSIDLAGKLQACGPGNYIHIADFLN
jgi:hypothetical protein